MNCEELNLENCYWCDRFIDDCTTEFFLKQFKAYKNFDEIMNHFITLQSERYVNHFIAILRLINLQWYDRLNKLIILK
jgi:hypothetical protein